MAQYGNLGGGPRNYFAGGQNGGFGIGILPQFMRPGQNPEDIGGAGTAGGAGGAGSGGGGSAGDAGNVWGNPGGGVGMGGEGGGGGGYQGQTSEASASGPSLSITNPGAASTLAGGMNAFASPGSLLGLGPVATTIGNRAAGMAANALGVGSPFAGAQQIASLIGNATNASLDESSQGPNTAMPAAIADTPFGLANAQPEGVNPTTLGELGSITADITSQNPGFTQTTGVGPTGYSGTVGGAQIGQGPLGQQTLNPAATAFGGSLRSGQDPEAEGGGNNGPNAGPPGPEGVSGPGPGTSGNPSGVGPDASSAGVAGVGEGGQGMSGVDGGGSSSSGTSGTGGGEGSASGSEKKGGKVGPGMPKGKTLPKRPDAKHLSERLKQGGKNTAGSASSKEDDVPVNLQKGEMVVNRNATKKFEPQLQAINQMGRTGGMGIGRGRR